MTGLRGLWRIVLALAATSAVSASASERAARVQNAARSCPHLGSGFVRQPGGITCVRVAGRVSGGIDARARHVPVEAPVVAGRLSIDARTQSDFGPVRTFVRIRPGP